MQWTRGWTAWIIFQRQTRFFSNVSPLPSPLQREVRREDSAMRSINQCKVNKSGAPHCLCEGTQETHLFLLAQPSNCLKRNICLHKHNTFRHPSISLMKSHTNWLHLELLSHPGLAVVTVHIIKHVELLLCCLIEFNLHMFLRCGKWLWIKWISV